MESFSEVGVLIGLPQRFCLSEGRAKNIGEDTLLCPAGLAFNAAMHRLQTCNGSTSHEKLVRLQCNSCFQILRAKNFALNSSESVIFYVFSFTVGSWLMLPIASFQ